MDVFILEAEVVYDGKYLHSSMVSNMFQFVSASRAESEQCWQSATLLMSPFAFCLLPGSLEQSLAAWDDEEQLEEASAQEPVSTHCPSAGITDVSCTNCIQLLFSPQKRELAMGFQRGARLIKDANKSSIALHVPISCRAKNRRTWGKYGLCLSSHSSLSSFNPV